MREKGSVRAAHPYSDGAYEMGCYIPGIQQYNRKHQVTICRYHERAPWARLLQIPATPCNSLFTPPSPTGNCFLCKDIPKTKDTESTTTKKDGDHISSERPDLLEACLRHLLPRCIAIDHRSSPGAHTYVFEFSVTCPTSQESRVVRVGSFHQTDCSQGCDDLEMHLNVQNM